MVTCSLKIARPRVLLWAWRTADVEEVKWNLCVVLFHRNKPKIWHLFVLCSVNWSWQLTSGTLRHTKQPVSRRWPELWETFLNAGCSASTSLRSSRACVSDGASRHGSARNARTSKTRRIRSSARPTYSRTTGVSFLLFEYCTSTILFFPEKCIPTFVKI